MASGWFSRTFYELDIRDNVMPTSEYTVPYQATDRIAERVKGYGWILEDMKFKRGCHP